MKTKIIFTFITSIILAGCSVEVIDENDTNTQKQEEKEDTIVISQQEKDEQYIKDFFEEHLEYSKIDITPLEESGKYNVDIIINKKYEDWYECGNFIKENEIVKELAEDNFSKADLEKVSIFCYNNGSKVGGVISTDFENINNNHYYVNAEGTKKTDSDFKNYVSDYKKSCKKYDYKTIYRNPEKYIGKRAYFKGEIIQVMEDYNGDYRLRVNVTKEGNYYTYYTDTIYVYMSKKAFTSGRPLEDDIIIMYGELGDLTTYETVMGSTVTIPTLYAKYVQLSK